MQTINLVFLLVTFSFTFARFLRSPAADNFIEWYPPALNTISPTQSEFAHLYFGYGNIEDLPELSELTTQLFFNTVDNKQNAMNQTAFYLYTKKNRHKSQTLILNDLNSLENSNWDPLKPTRIIIHGFQANSKENYIQEMKNRFLDLDESNNVITVDWSNLLGYLYPNAVYWTDKVGQICGLMIDFLCKQGGQTSQFHIIGHSLGAHVAGFAAKTTTAGKIGRVTGLDPAYPGFISEDRNGRLDSADADFVDCIHTCGGIVAFHQPICDADYYPNGGICPQPGCSGFFYSTTCSHSRAHELFVESIIKGHIFPAFTCTDVPMEKPTKCEKEGAILGFPARSDSKGIFYSVTNAEFPFAPILVEKNNEHIL